MIFMNITRSPVHFWTDFEKIKNKNVEIYTIDRLCSILHCEIEDIVEHVPEPDERNEHTEKASEKNNPYSEDKKNSL